LSYVVEHRSSKMMALKASADMQMYLHNCSLWYAEFGPLVSHPSPLVSDHQQQQQDTLPALDKEAAQAAAERMATMGAATYIEAGKLRFWPVETVPAAHDYDRDAWCPVPEYNHWAARATRKTAEVVTVVTTPMADTGVCWLVESAIRMGYNMTILTVPRRLSTQHDRVYRTLLYGRLLRARILQSLDYFPADIEFTVELLNSIEEPDARSEAKLALVEYLEKHPHLFLGANAVNVMLQLSPRELHDKLDGLRAQLAQTNPKADANLTMSSEANLFPKLNYSWFPERDTQLFPFTNSDLWVARLDRMLEFTDTLHRSTFDLCEPWEQLDQCKALVAIHAGPAHSAFGKGLEHDVNATILQNMFPHPYNLRRPRTYRVFDPTLHLGLTPDGLIARRDLNNTPVAVHWNSSKMRNFNARHLNITANIASVEYAVYSSLGWMRRTLPDGRQPHFFHLTMDHLHQYLTILNADLHDDDALRDDLYHFCTLGLQDSIAKNSQILSSLGLIRDKKRPSATTKRPK